MKRAIWAVLAFAAVVASWSILPLAQRTDPPSPAGAATSTYFPERFDWQHRKPEDVGMNGALVNDAVKVAVASESTTPRDQMENQASSFGRTEPHSTVIGPMKTRGPASA